MLRFKGQSLKALHKVQHILSIRMLNPRIFFKKTIGRMFLNIVPAPKGMVCVKFGEHYIETIPSRNDWWKSMYIKHCGVEIDPCRQ
jgi:hypothetical protein